MKKLKLLVVAVAVLGFITFFACKPSGQKTEGEETDTITTEQELTQAAEEVSEDTTAELEEAEDTTQAEEAEEAEEIEETEESED